MAQRCPSFNATIGAEGLFQLRRLSMLLSKRPATSLEGKLLSHAIYSLFQACKSAGVRYQAEAMLTGFVKSA